MSALVPDDHVGELQQEIADYKNAWGRVTKLLDVPWDASGGKVCEEIRKLQQKIRACHRTASAAPQGDCSVTGLIERLALIEKGSQP